VSLDLAPAPGAAPRARRVLGHARMEATLLVRNGEQLLLNLVIPVGALVAGLMVGDRLGLDPREFPASVMALALWSTGFTSLAINTGFERRYGVLERLAATPLTRGDLVLGKALATASVAAGQLIVLAVVAAALGWRPSPTLPQSLIALAGAALAVVTFAGLALALAGRLRAEATLGLANLIYLVVAAAGAVVLPASAYPPPLAGLLPWLPFGALGELLRGWAVGAAPWPPVAALAVWAVLSVVVARKAFRWTS
jgi:ABC-2 type transport system permease protein